MNNTYNVDQKGYYGEFGGAYIPEMMYPNIEELKSKYIKISSEKSFKKEFMNLDDWWPRGQSCVTMKRAWSLVFLALWSLRCVSSL